MMQHAAPAIWAHTCHPADPCHNAWTVTLTKASPCLVEDTVPGKTLTLVLKRDAEVWRWGCLQLSQLSGQGPKRLAQQLQRYGARSHLSFHRQDVGDASEGGRPIGA